MYNDKNHKPVATINSDTYSFTVYLSDIKLKEFSTIFIRNIGSLN